MAALAGPGAQTRPGPGGPSQPPRRRHYSSVRTCVAALVWAGKIALKRVGGDDPSLCAWHGGGRGRRARAAVVEINGSRPHGRHRGRGRSRLARGPGRARGIGPPEARRVTGIHCQRWRMRGGIENSYPAAGGALGSLQGWRSDRRGLSGHRDDRYACAGICQCRSPQRLEGPCGFGPDP